MNLQKRSARRTVVSGQNKGKQIAGICEKMMLIPQNAPWQ